MMEARIRCLLRQPVIMQDLELHIREMTIDTKKKSIYINNKPLELTKKDKRALEPVSRLSRKVREINENNLYQKIEVPQTRDEIGNLASSFNDMLERLNRSFTSQRSFALQTGDIIKP
jgi:methyl-accepting chemotaxis protein